MAADSGDKEAASAGASAGAQPAKKASDPAAPAAKPPASSAAPAAAAATAKVAEAGGKGAAPAAAEDKAVEVVVVQPSVTDATYGFAVDAAGAYDSARATIRQLQGTLADLKGMQAEASGDLAGAGAFTKLAHQLQLQLLALRRTHRTMAKAADTGKAAETAARRFADAEFAYLETKKYESACCRAAASYCRCLPTPSLTELRRHLDGPETVEAEQAEEEEDVAKEGIGNTNLSKRLVVEQQERSRLAGEHEELERQRVEKLKSFEETQQYGGDLIAKLLKAEAALEPVCDLLELRPRSSAVEAVPAAADQLPTPLRLIHNKFDVLAAFGSISGVTVAVEGVEDAGDGSEPPPAKRARAEGKFVRVTVDNSVTLRFSCAEIAGAEDSTAGTAIVGVSCSGCSDSLLENLWPKDDGMSGPLAAAGGKLAGRPYGWAQVLAGLRSQTSVLLSGGGALGVGGPLVDGSPVVASDLVQRLRGKLPAGQAKA